jgi:hypothetical protein
LNLSEWRVAAVLAALVGVAAAAMALARRRRVWRPALKGPLAAAALVAVLAAGYVDQRRFHDDRYADFDPVLAWVQERAPEGRRIGLARVWPFTFYSPPLAMYGPRLENTVEFIGPVRDGILEQYEDPREFRRAVERARLDLVLLQNPAQPGASLEERWLRPLGFKPVARSDILLLLGRDPIAG